MTATFMAAEWRPAGKQAALWYLSCVVRFDLMFDDTGCIWGHMTPADFPGHEAMCRQIPFVQLTHANLIWYHSEYQTNKP